MSTAKLHHSNTKLVARALSLCTALFLCTIMLVPATAGASDLAIGVKVGGNWSLLSKPNDPRGEPTLLTGSAFDGMGFVGGATAYYPLTEFEGAVLEFEGGLLYSNHAAEGFEQHTDSGQKRTITLEAQMLRVPLMVHLRRAAATTGFRVGLGLEPILGLQSGAVVDPGPEELHTTPTVHLGTTVALGFDWQANDAFSVPLEFRATWDPFVEASTKDRFENFSSASDPGEYQVAYDWQLLFMTGVRYEL
jgi:hypothetical protein